MSLVCSLRCFYEAEMILFHSSEMILFHSNAMILFHENASTDTFDCVIIRIASE